MAGRRSSLRRTRRSWPTAKGHPPSRKEHVPLFDLSHVDRLAVQGIGAESPAGGLSSTVLYSQADAFIMGESPDDHRGNLLVIYVGCN